MNKKIMLLAVFTLINIAWFYFTPFLMKDTGSSMSMLLLVVPLCCLVTSSAYGTFNAFNLSGTGFYSNDLDFL